MNRFAATTAAVLAVTAIAHAAITTSEADRLAAAAQVIRAADADVASDLWNESRCVIAVPDMKKAAFIVGGEYGRGVMSCRAGDRWSAPVFMQLAKGSWGLQVGAEQVDLVLLVMNEQGVQKLLDNKVSLGVDASIAAGPVGRRAVASTDAYLKAEILSYSRSQGLFAGIDLSGGVLRPDQDANHDVYGSNATARTILATSGVSAPTQATAFLNALDTVAARSAPNRPTATGGASAAAQAAPARPTNTAPPTTDSDLRARIVALQQNVDRLLADSGSPASSANAGAATVAVDRRKLTELRQQLDGLLAALDKR